MESTGVCWKPVWHIPKGLFELVLGNAAHIRNVPGRKTDVNDATWIADLLAHGLIRGSFVPPTAIQELRTLTRTRKQLVREQAQHVQRIQKTLEDANLKIASAVSDIVDVRSRSRRPPERDLAGWSAGWGPRGFIIGPLAAGQLKSICHPGADVGQADVR